MQYVSSACGMLSVRRQLFLVAGGGKAGVPYWCALLSLVEELSVWNVYGSAVAAVTWAPCI